MRRPHSPGTCWRWENTCSRRRRSSRRNAPHRASAAPSARHGAARQATDPPRWPKPGRRIRSNAADPPVSAAAGEVDRHAPSRSRLAAGLAGSSPAASSLANTKASTGDCTTPGFPPGQRRRFTGWNDQKSNPTGLTNPALGQALGQAAKRSQSQHVFEKISNCPPMIDHAAILATHFAWPGDVFA